MPPFSDEKPIHVFKNILDRNFTIPKFVPPVLRDFLNSLIVYEPEGRLGAKDVSLIRAATQFSSIRSSTLFPPTTTPAPTH
jgi:hypothetical protein